MQPGAAAITFFALGVVTFAAVAMLLLSPRNREARWFVAFSAAVMAWLLGQGLELLAATGTVARAWRLAGTGLMPGLFVAMAAAAHGAWARRGPWVAAATAVAALFVVVLTEAGGVRPGRTIVLYHVAGWLTGAVLLLRQERVPAHKPAAPAGARRAILAIGAVTPLVVVAGLLSGVGPILTSVVPALVVTTYMAVFAGVARLRFYDIEVRAARSGELAAEAVETSRLATIGEMAASFAHEVRNPLTGVRSLAQRIAEDDVPDAKRRRYAAVMLDELGRVERIVDGLLDVSRRAPLHRDPPADTTLDPLFDDIALLTGARARRAGVDIETDGRGLRAAAPREALAQALLNLVLNAIAHSPAGGRVTVTAAAAPGRIEIDVCDQGPGVPAAERDVIFERFHTARPDGAGLGLSVVRSLARELGWTAAVDDAPGGGARFRLSLPDRATAASDPEPAATGASGGGT